MANKLILLPEQIYKSLTSPPDTGEPNLDFAWQQMENVRRQRTDPSKKNIRYNQELRRYLTLRRERENRPIKVTLDNGARILFKKGDEEDEEEGIVLEKPMNRQRPPTREEEDPWIDDEWFTSAQTTPNISIPPSPPPPPFPSYKPKVLASKEASTARRFPVPPPYGSNEPKVGVSSETHTPYLSYPDEIFRQEIDEEPAVQYRQIPIPFREVPPIASFPPKKWKIEPFPGPTISEPSDDEMEFLNAPAPPALDLGLRNAITNVVSEAKKNANQMPMQLALPSSEQVQQQLATIAQSNITPRDGRVLQRKRPNRSKPPFPLSQADKRKAIKSAQEKRKHQDELPLAITGPPEFGLEEQMQVDLPSTSQAVLFPRVSLRPGVRYRPDPNLLQIITQGVRQKMYKRRKNGEEEPTKRLRYEQLALPAPQRLALPAPQRLAFPEPPKFRKLQTRSEPSGVQQKTIRRKQWAHRPPTQAEALNVRNNRILLRQQEVHIHPQRKSVQKAFAKIKRWL